MDCPQDSNSGNKSSLLTNCTCNKGFTGQNGGTCSPCEAGKFKSHHGAAPCSFCPEGKFSTGTSETSQSACIECPPLTCSELGSSSISNCSCSAGHTGSGHNCTACVAGTFKNSTGSLPCVGCIGGTYSGPSASTCLLCPEIVIPSQTTRILQTAAAMQALRGRQAAFVRRSSLPKFRQQ